MDNEGVIQMINKLEFDGEIGRFTADDVEVLETFARFIAPKVGRASLLTGDSKRQPIEKPAEARLAFASKTDPAEQQTQASKAEQRKKRQSLAAVDAADFAEGDEEED
mmetsp:Transcript_28821/g.61432  ORF Transcript_28821/g.61432 Transcript_28821/m.61432 type:complete len:108 (+) Transcript_28821:3-326(+)